MPRGAFDTIYKHEWIVVGYDVKAPELYPAVLNCKHCGHQFFGHGVKETLAQAATQNDIMIEYCYYSKLRTLKQLLLAKL